MNSTDPQNAYFTRVVDGDREHILTDLAAHGVHIPAGFQVIAGHAAVPVSATTTSAASVVDARGVPILIGAGRRVIHAIAVSEGTVQDATSLGLDLDKDVAPDHLIVDGAVELPLVAAAFPMVPVESDAMFVNVSITTATTVVAQTFHVYLIVV